MVQSLLTKCRVLNNSCTGQGEMGGFRRVLRGMHAHTHIFCVVFPAVQIMQDLCKEVQCEGCVTSVQSYVKVEIKAAEIKVFD